MRKQIVFELAQNFEEKNSNQINADHVLNRCFWFWEVSC